MVNVGEKNKLCVKRMHTLGAFLDGGESGEVLLPKKSLPSGCKPGDELEVFVYVALDEQLLASIKMPTAQVGDVAWLKAVAVNKIGAFLDWGLPKDLLAPYSEQPYKMEVGHHYLVVVFLDDSNRIAASARVNEFMEDENEGKFTVGQEVTLIIADKTDLGVKAVVDNTHWGVLYKNELFQNIRKGQKYTGYIKKIRDDDRLDVSLQKPGYSKERMDGIAGKVLDEIEAQGGFLALNDKSKPEDIYNTFGVSKKMFKQAIGKLYKKRMITIEADGVRAVDKD